MIDTAQFLFQQSPVFWYVLSGAFFLLGVLYAQVAWRSFKNRLRSAQREKSQLLRERNQAIADRQRRRRLKEQDGKTTPQVSTSTTASDRHVTNLTSAAPVPPISSNGRNGVATNGSGKHQVDPTDHETSETKARRLAAEHAIRKRETSQQPHLNSTNGASVNGNSTNGQQQPNSEQSDAASKLSGLFSTNYHSSGPKKNGTKTQ